MKPPEIPQLIQGVSQPPWLNRMRFGVHTSAVPNNLMFKTGQTIYTPTMFMSSVQQPDFRSEIPCKEILSGGGYLRRAAPNINQGYVPATGNQHGSRLGMASTPQHPTNLPLPPQANSFYAYLNSDLTKPVVMKKGKIVKKK